MKKLIQWFKSQKSDLTKILIIIGIILILIFIITKIVEIFNRSKTQEKLLIERVQFVKDSTKISFEIKLQQIEDSVRHLKYQRDSISRVAQKNKTDLKSSTSRVKDLLKLRDDFNTIKENYEDTLRFISECKELRAENKTLIKRVEDAEQSQQVLNDKNIELTDKLEEAITTRDSAYNSLDSSFQQLASISNKMENDLKKARKQANKRVIFGPIGGVTYTNQVAPIAGFGVVIRLGRLF